MMKIFIVTGASRGIGAAMVEALLSPQHRVYGIARSENPDLSSKAAAEGSHFDMLSLDLNEPSAALLRFRQLLQTISPEAYNSIALVHNAGVLEPVGAVGSRLKEEDLSRSIRVNLQSPILLTEAFIAFTQNWQMDKKVLAISSGAARRPLEAWAAYCSTKAGLDMFCRCIAEEQANQPYPVQLKSLAPGVVDTDMQGLIRAFSEEQFPNVQRFLDLKKNEQLWSADFVGEKIAALLQQAWQADEVIADLRNLV